jgi:hypothetical protein
VVQSEDTRSLGRKTRAFSTAKGNLVLLAYAFHALVSHHLGTISTATSMNNTIPIFRPGTSRSALKFVAGIPVQTNGMV